MLLWTFSFKKHYKLIIDFLKIIVLKFLSKLEKAQTTMVWASFVHSHFLFLGIESLLSNIEYLFVFVKSYLQQSSHLSIRFVSTSGDIFSLSNPIFHLTQSHFFNRRWWKNAIFLYSRICDTLNSSCNIFSCHASSPCFCWFCCKSQKVLIPKISEMVICGSHLVISLSS